MFIIFNLLYKNVLTDYNSNVSLNVTELNHYTVYIEHLLKM